MSRRHPGRSVTETPYRERDYVGRTSVKVGNVPRPNVEFRVDIDLRCKELSDAQIAFLEHVAYNAAHQSISMAIGLMLDTASVPRKAA